MNPLKQLEQSGQSPWLDFIQRSFTEQGKLAAMVEQDGLRGVTSNPAIFQKAMGEGTDYDDGFAKLAHDADHNAQDIYEALAIGDIQQAADVLRPVFDRTQGGDGYVSMEVSPYLALHTEETVEEARRLWKAVDRPNLMVKVPGTDKGVSAIRTLIGDGININVTLLFSQKAYQAVADAYIAGLEERHGRGEDISHIGSVASFFVSRIDAKIDKEIDERVKNNDPESAALKAVRGKVAIANAKVAYQWYLDMVKGERWQKLAAAGANPQRLLWASTGTKDKAYSDVLYVEELIGPDTVNTIPPATMDAFRDHGRVRPSLTEDLDGAKHVLAEAERLGLDLQGVTLKLVDEGVELFAEAADKLLGSVAAKRQAMLGDKLVSVSRKLPDEMEKQVVATLDTWREEGSVRSLWVGDAKLWTGADESKWLGWLEVVNDQIADLPKLRAFQDEVKAGGFSHVLLLGMGGSSLGPEVLAETFGRQPGFPELLVLDSTDPAQISSFERRVDMAKTLVIVSSKSGGTLEPNILKAYFWDRMKAAVGAEKAGQHFVAVTDPGSHMQQVAEGDGFRRVFFGNKAIGGRYSVLSNFGMVPAAAMGLDLGRFLDATALMVRSCAPGTPPVANPGVQLGAVLGLGATHGRDKVTIVASPGIHDLGAWLEQLLAESTGKQGHGIVPVDNETPGAPGVYGDDRLFAYLRLAKGGDPAQDAAVEKLEAAGQPVVRVDIADTMQVGQVFFVWEFATAVAGSVIGINPFDQPDVEASKVETRKLTDEYGKSGQLPAESPFAAFDGVRLFADKANADALKANDLDGVLRQHLSRVKPGDYVALLAYVDRNEDNKAALQDMRMKLRDAKRVATVAEFGPRFLHSTGQTYKGGPNSGVFIQVTADDAQDLTVPGEKYTFSVVKAAQARGDFDVLSERGRRALRVHLGSDVKAGLTKLSHALEAAVG